MKETVLTVKIAKKNGLKFVLMKLVEECGEVVQAVMKYLCFIKINGSLTGINFAGGNLKKLKNNVASEIADIEFLIEQIKILSPELEERIKEEKHVKILRTTKLLKLNDKRSKTNEK